MDLDDLNDALAESNERARSGRRAAWVGFVVTAALVALFVALFATAPQCAGMCPLIDAPPGPGVGDVTLGVGFAGLAAGLIWMWRIVRADRDPEARGSRSLQRH